MSPQQGFEEVQPIGQGFEDVRPIAPQGMSITEAIKAEIADQVRSAMSTYADVLHNPGKYALGGQAVMAYKNLIEPNLKAAGRTAGEAYRLGKQMYQNPTEAADLLHQNLPTLGMHAIESVTPVAGPMAMRLQDIAERPEGTREAIGRGLVNAAELAGPEVAPKILGATGKALRQAGETQAESALGIGWRQRGRGKTIGHAAMAETKGFAPEASLETGEARLQNLGEGIADIYDQAGPRGNVSLKPAIDVLLDEKANALKRRNTILANDIQKNIDRISTDPATGAQRTSVSPLEGWNIKRGQGELTNWNPTLNPKTISAINQRVYGALDNELDAIAPEAQSLNQRYSSLREVVNRLDVQTKSAGVGQRVMARLARPTGAMASALTGGAAGGVAGGPIGALAGGAAGLVAPELISSPTVQMAIARGLYRLGGGEFLPDYIAPNQAPAAMTSLGNLRYQLAARNINQRGLQQGQAQGVAFNPTMAAAQARAAEAALPQWTPAAAQAERLKTLTRPATESTTGGEGGPLFEQANQPNTAIAEYELAKPRERVQATFEPVFAQVQGSDTSVRVPGEATEYPAKYAVLNLEDVKPSHNGLSFGPNPKYKLANDRDYTNPANQGKIINWSAPGQFEPRYHVTNNPDALNGPVVVDQEGHALGGNGRAMILQRVYKNNPEGAEAYKNQLVKQAATFGLDPEKIAQVKNPVLVRMIDNEKIDQMGGSAKTITALNKKGTAELTPAERAIADARGVSQGTLDDIGQRLQEAGEDATLKQVLEGEAGKQVAQNLIRDGVITPQEWASMAGRSGLTEAGKARISAIMIGRFFDDAAHLEGTPGSIRAKLERISAPLAKAAAVPGWDLTDTVKGATRILEEARIHGIENLDELTNQQGLFGSTGNYNPAEVEMAKALLREKPLRLTKAARRFAQDAHDTTRPMLGMLAELPTPGKSFAEAFTQPEVIK